MISKLHGLSKLAVSMVMLCGISLTIAIIAYQTFSPQGRIFLSLRDMWDSHPMVLLGFGGSLLMAKNWVNGYHPGQRLSNGIVYVAAFVGIAIMLKYYL